MQTSGDLGNFWRVVFAFFVALRVLSNLTTCNNDVAEDNHISNYSFDIYILLTSIFLNMLPVIPTIILSSMYTPLVFSKVLSTEKNNLARFLLAPMGARCCTLFCVSQIETKTLEKTNSCG